MTAHADRDRSEQPTVTTPDDERLARYAEAMDSAYRDYTGIGDASKPMWQYVPSKAHREIAAPAAMAVADAEQAELRVWRDRYLAQRDIALRDWNQACDRADAAERALADERAKVERVEALAETFEQEDLDLGAASYHLAGEAQDASDELARESETWRSAATLLRAALAGPEPDTTKEAP